MCQIMKKAKVSIDSKTYKYKVEEKGFRFIKDNWNLYKKDN